MAKDGTNRGGARAGAGRKPKPLTEKITEGRRSPVNIQSEDELAGVDMPPVKEFMTMAQRDGEDIEAKEIYIETMQWLKRHGCQDLVTPLLVQQYAMHGARWIQAQKGLSKFGLIGKHPTTGAPIASPFVSIDIQYSKQAMQAWYQIYSIVKANSTADYNGANPQDSLMERLLKARSGKP